MSPLRHLDGEVSLEEFLERVRPRLRAIFGRYRIPPADSEDILQQALLALVYHRDGVRDPEAWLLGTLRNKCMVYWRDHHRRLYDAVDSSDLEWMAEPAAPAQDRQDLWNDLSTIIGQLPERCQSVLWLRYRMGFESQEIAEILGYSPNSISKISTRCLAALTRRMGLAAGGLGDGEIN